MAGTATLAPPTSGSASASLAPPTSGSASAPAPAHSDSDWDTLNLEPQASSFEPNILEVETREWRYGVWEYGIGVFTCYQLSVLSYELS